MTRRDDWPARAQLGHVGVMRCETCNRTNPNRASRCWYVVRVMPDGTSRAAGPYRTQTEARAHLRAALDGINRAVTL